MAQLYQWFSTQFNGRGYAFFRKNLPSKMISSKPIFNLLTNSYPLPFCSLPLNQNWGTQILKSS